jgi:hypothetical protein
MRIRITLGRRFSGQSSAVRRPTLIGHAPRRVANRNFAGGLSSCKTWANVEQQQKRRRVSEATAVVVDVRYSEGRRQLRAQNGFIIARTRPRWSLPGALD